MFLWQSAVVASCDNTTVRRMASWELPRLKRGESLDLQGGCKLMLAWEQTGDLTSSKLSDFISPIKIGIFFFVKFIWQTMSSAVKIHRH